MRTDGYWFDPHATMTKGVPTAHAIRLRKWDIRLQENQGKTMRFAFEKKGRCE